LKKENPKKAKKLKKERKRKNIINTIQLEVVCEIKGLTIYSPEVKGDLKIPVLDLDKFTVDNRPSLPKTKRQIEGNVSVPTIKIPSVKTSVDIRLKKGKSSSSSSSSDEKKKKKKKGGIDLKVGAKIEDPTIDNPKVKGDLKIQGLDVDKSKIDIRLSLSKSKAGIEEKISIPSKDANFDLDLKKETPKSRRSQKKGKRRNIINQKLILNLVQRSKFPILTN
jgi:hypothetical protein